MNNYLILAFVLTTVFTVSLTENLQIADGFLSQSTKGWVYELNPGESGVFTWTLTNTEEVAIDIEFRSEGPGSELFVFEKLVTMESKESTSFEFIVVVPKDHPDNVEYRPVLFALEKAKHDGKGGAAVLINYQMSAKPVILIGDEPVFTPELIPEVEEPKPVVEQQSPGAIEITREETLDEKLARIASANEIKAVDEPKIDDTWQEDPVPELQVDDNYLEEPIVDPKPTVTTPIPVKIECGFIDWLLSLFGMAKC